MRSARSILRISDVYSLSLLVRSLLAQWPNETKYYSRATYKRQIPEKGFEFTMSDKLQFVDRSGRRQIRRKATN